MYIVGKYQDCSKLPDLTNGEVDCNNYITGKSCDLTCQDGYEFTTSEDPSPQLCIDGRWNYQMGQRAFPTCQGVYCEVYYISSSLSILYLGSLVSNLLLYVYFVDSNSFCCFMDGRLLQFFD